MLKNILISVVLICCAHTVWATNQYSAPYTQQSSSSIYTVNLDGTFVAEVILRYRINSEDGINLLSQIPLTYSTSLEELDVVEAYTLGADGKKTPVTADKILLQQSPLSAGAPMFDDVKVKNVIFPAVSIGSVLHLHFRQTQKTALFPGVFSALFSFPRDRDYERVTVEVRAPAELPLHVETIDVSGGEVASTTRGTKIWRWTLANARALAPEGGAVSSLDFSPRIAISSLPDYHAVARAYLARARAKAKVTPAVRKLADDITKGISDKRAQAEALYRWVSANIRYVAIYFGFGGVVPHDADAILHARYGDCKDHVTLLEALLAAKNIRSSPVLVNASDAWWLPKVAVPAGIFNHAITYLPDWKIFVDSTVGFAPFGVLPPSELGKLALITDDAGEEGAASRLVKLPLANATVDTVKVTTQLQLTKEGTVKGTSQVDLHGVPELVSRASLSGIRSGTERQAAAQFLSMRQQQGSGTLKLGDAYDLAHPYRYSSTFELPDYVDTHSPGGFVIPAGIGALDGLSTVASHCTELPERKFPFHVGNSRVEEFTKLTLPAGMKVIRLPKSVTLEKPFASYMSRYTQQGQQVTVERVLERKFPHAVLPADAYPEVRKFGLAVSYDLRAQILIE